MLCAGTCWGLMAPIGKDAMLNGIDGIDLVSFRVLGGALLFWLTSLFTKKEHVPVKDILLLGCAGLFALVFNQCSYTIGLNLTSPQGRRIKLNFPSTAYLSSPHSIPLSVVLG